MNILFSHPWSHISSDHHQSPLKTVFPKKNFNELEKIIFYLQITFENTTQKDSLIGHGIDSVWLLCMWCSIPTQGYGTIMVLFLSLVQSGQIALWSRKVLRQNQPFLVYKFTVFRYHPLAWTNQWVYLEYYEGTVINDAGFQVYLLEGLARWNEDRCEAIKGERTPLLWYSAEVNVMNELG